MTRDQADEYYLTVAEVAELLRLNQQTVRNWIDQGSLPALRVGRRVRIKQSDLDRLLSEGYSAGSQADSPQDGPSAEDFWGGEPVGVAEPAVGLAEPAVGVAEPAVGVAEPAVGLAEPAVGLAEPAVGLAEPAVGVAEAARAPAAESNDTPTDATNGTEPAARAAPTEMAPRPG